MKKNLGITTPDNIDTGLGPIPIKHWDGTEYWTKQKRPVRFTTLAIDTGMSALNLIREIKESGTAAAKNETLQLHTRSLGQWLAIMAGGIEGKLFSTKVDSMEIARLCLHVGMIYERFKLSENEKPAMAGKRSRAAAKRKGRAAPEGSLRSVFETQAAGWRDMSAGRLLIIAKKAFPHSTPENLSRQISRLKKGGQ
jgi:hypothetical protein